MEALLPFFQWMQNLPLSQFFLNTTWATPIVQVIHIVAVTSFVGGLLVVDIRLLGGGLMQTPLPQLARSTQPVLIWSFAVLVVTGVPQMTSLAMKQYYSPFFWWKMEAMLIALILTVTIRQRIANAAEGQFGDFWPKVIGLTSLGLWSAVIIGARLIGLFS